MFPYFSAYHFFYFLLFFVIKNEFIYILILNLNTPNINNNIIVTNVVYEIDNIIPKYLGTLNLFIDVDYNIM